MPAFRGPRSIAGSRPRGNCSTRSPCGSGSTTSAPSPRPPPISRDRDRLDAVLRVIVEYQQSYPGLRMVDIEPAHVIKRLAQILPLMRERLERLTPGRSIWRRRRPCASRFPTTWCSVTMPMTSSRSCGMPPESSTRSRLLEFGENFVGVLAEQRRGRPRRPRRAVKVGRSRDHRHAGVAVRHVDDAARGVELLVGHHILDGVDRRPEEIWFARKGFRPLVERPWWRRCRPARR